MRQFSTLVDARDGVIVLFSDFAPNAAGQYSPLGTPAEYRMRSILVFQRACTIRIGNQSFDRTFSYRLRFSRAPLPRGAWRRARRAMAWPAE